jgi:hypothetical protein
MNVDIYKISKELSKEITDLGFGNISEEIENIISGGSTGTEILMGLRWKFSEILKNEKHKLPKNIQNKIKDIITLSNKFLNK